MKHEIEDDISNTPFRILYPVATTLKVRDGVYNRFVFAPGKGQPWTKLAQAWQAYPDKDAMLALTGFMPGVKAKCVIIPVKRYRMERPSINLPYLAKKLVAYGKKEGWFEVALAKSHWLNSGFTAAEVQALVDGLEQGGLTVHEYE